jgi:bacteriorhodopsin
MITIIAALSYFAMATGTGVSYHHIRVREQHSHGVPATYKHIVRQVYWARYIDWALTTPLLLLDLSLLANLSGANILVAVLADVIMILTGLFAAFGREHNGSKWGWYVEVLH